MEKKKIKILINGKAYTLLHDETEDYMRRIEHYLNTRVISVTNSGIQLSEQTALVMSAISIIDELFRIQKNFNTLKNEMQKMMDEYDNLKLDKQDADMQLTNAERQIDSLSKQILLLQKHDQK